MITDRRVRAICAHCQKSFEQYLSVAKRREKITCSLSCARSYTPSKKRDRVTLSCLTCKSDFEVAAGRKNKAKYCSVSCKNIRQRGENGSNYKDGRSKERGQHRKVIYKRVKEEGKCEECGEKENLHGHHIKSYADHPELRSEPSNIQVLCDSCHAGKHPNLARKLFKGVPRSGVNKKCPVCESEFYVKKSHADKRTCCSMRCAGIFKSS